MNIQSISTEDTRVYGDLILPKATLLYEAAQAVFRSLPTRDIVESFTAEAMEEYNVRHDLDGRDTWHNTCTWWLRPTTWGYALRFDTATTVGRSVEVEVIDGHIQECRVVFVGGSENAAGGVIDQYQNRVAEWVCQYPHDIPRLLNACDAQVVVYGEQGYRPSGACICETEDGYMYTLSLVEE